MKLAMYKSKQGERPALVVDDSILDLMAWNDDGNAGTASGNTLIPYLDPNGSLHQSARRLADEFQSGGEAAQKLRERKIVHALDSVSLAPPLRPRLILCGAMGYKDHLDEMDVSSLPKTPDAFIKMSSCIIGPDEPIVLPANEPDMVDFECELSVVFARRCHCVSEDEALSYIGGITMINDVGSREGLPEWEESVATGDALGSMNLFHRIVRGKQFATFCPLGPVVTTIDEIDDLADINLGTRLNGRVMQSANTSNLIFSVAQSVSYFSQWYDFMPGDVLSTGSPAGVGYAQDPKIFLGPGDIVEVYADHVEALVNTVVAPA